MRPCDSCGASVNDGAGVCAACGAPVGLSLEMTSALPSRGAITADGTMVLPRGTMRTEQTTIASHPPLVAPSPAPVPTAPITIGPGTVVAGKYTVLEPAGAGGMGQVWKARHEGLDALVCVKVLRGDFAGDREMVARFEAEARSASRLRHPNSIQMLDYGQLPDGTCYLVMEFVQGRVLSAVLAADGAMPERRVVHIGAQVLAALQAAHDAGVVHRDLKPGNVMLEKIGDDPDFVKVLDFGIAKMATRDGSAPALDAEEPEGVVGTPAYMSPEQGAGRAVDHRSDLYSVGVLLYRMVTGLLPFEGRSAGELFRQHASRAPTPPRVRHPGADCSAELEALLLRALEKDPVRRPQSAEEFRKELLSIGARQAARAAPPMLDLDPTHPRGAGTSLELPAFDSESTRAIAPTPSRGGSAAAVGSPTATPAAPPSPITPPATPPVARPAPVLTEAQQLQLQRERDKARRQRRLGPLLKLLTASLVLGGGWWGWTSLAPPELQAEVRGRVEQIAGETLSTLRALTGQVKEEQATEPAVATETVVAPLPPPPLPAPPARPARPAPRPGARPMDKGAH